jgi:hypothetical protein
VLTVTKKRYSDTCLVAVMSNNTCFECLASVLFYETEDKCAENCENFKIFNITQCEI